ncbi:folate-binding protein YgfZ [Pseudomonas aeruginosa]|uniref:CAF17-like 4Fe-4S cluster assembly/insertion protein YgfZ n=1 Tax=Pseudomonas paraeruginosa TaxID=2994495 RepID=UPI0018C54D51|nr:folate-binding protein YgfZ [Pseudomonas aeruginosa]MBG7003839.1 folate-binding protein YgfZ [Pseudomonas aeruginosa]MBG7025263.1 folate-binding protein YgfZ [Pseudomonas aeruginosa]MBG7372213.1 folate-binding protein YgfZ [Pseudomonas aeruginosa]MEA8481497.1 folate-binding protein YgfZ [Pseudomonas aeruginosa]
MADSAFHTPLVHEGILAVRGPDAAKFLQGQLTCNLAYLNDETSSLGGRCTIKGRLLSSFRILLQGDGLLLALASELLEAQLADLKKYAVFSKATLADESAAWVRVGLRDAGEALRALGIEAPAEAGGIARHADLLAVALGDARVELWIPAARAEAVLATLREHSREAPLDDWLLGQVRAGIGQVFGATRELFIPQMINLQAVGGVSFKKGCYTGQEIVARMQYLGRLKRRLYRLALAGEDPPEPATGLFSPVHATSVGEVVLAARTPENTVELLAVLQDDAVADGRITLGSSDGAPLVLLNLPYTLDSDREIQR